MSIRYSDWYGCYKRGWGGVLTPAAFQHPAKVSLGLAERIYDYLLENKMVKEGDTVLDPFGGIAGFGYSAMYRGLHFIGCELEDKFVALGNQNIALWNARYAGKMPRWGSARLVQGDSRHLRDVIAQASAAVSSPPYADGCAHTGVDDPHPEHIQGGEYHGVGIHGAVSSSPYNLPMSQDHNGTLGGKRGTTPAEQGAFVKYGNTDGQIEGLPMSEEGFNAAVSSPPYEHRSYEGLSDSFAEWRTVQGRSNDKPGVIGVKEGYGKTEGQMAGSGDFWSAARQVVAETYAVLAPGAVAVFVVKDFIRNKARVPFCDQWRQLCEACGFSTYAIARAWLVEDHGTQLAMDGNHKRKRTERKSFFRRLAERKGSPRIDFETVLIMRKPEAAA